LLCYYGSMLQKVRESLPYRKPDVIEPGLLPLFRTYIIVVDVIVLLNLLFTQSPRLNATHPLFYPVIGMLAMLNIYLFNRGLSRRLKGYYLAIGLFIYLVFSAFLLWGTLTLSLPAEMFDWLRLYFSFGFSLLFIPLMIAAWQYGFRGTIGYVLISSLLEALIFLIVIDDPRQWYLAAFIVFRSVNFSVIGAIIARLMLAQRRQRHELRAANQQLTYYTATLEQLAVSRERNRLARELHDTLAHTLSGVSVQLEAVRTLWDKRPEEARQLLQQALLDTRDGLTNTRRALEDLRAEPLEDLGLRLALENLTRAFAERTQIETTFAMAESLSGHSLSAAVQNCLYRTLQEALSNIDRHAAASQVSVRLTEKNQADVRNLALHIEDNGRGFDCCGNPEEGHFGLRGMRERAEILGGSLHIDSQPGKGTRLTLSLKEYSHDTIAAG
jgi:signal transduction histidine kinase